ncbi:electron transport complex subunit RsxG [Halioxenophilus sp. WMMB6]|uniref:electron transport complex subunit RsxG n=1 Tax=Halioxenophilus sp. WMMB6 TaxID=3073815 RepID=UPI00295E4A94|nr:electron transport complex subunit RsxG [Halioxenophilus sp. WMMB6]
MLGRAISKNSLVLALFALCTAGVLATTYQLTKERVAKSERTAAAKALLEIVPQTMHDNDLLVDIIPVPEAAWSMLGLAQPANINIAKLHGEITTVIVPATAPDGYSGAIGLIVGVNRDGSLAGVRVLTHGETPGLGDKVDLRKSGWVLGFIGKSLSNPTIDSWAVKKDGGEFDQFTGATITPRAVVKQVRKVLEFAEHYQSQLFNLPPAGDEEAPDE